MPVGPQHDRTKYDAATRTFDAILEHANYSLPAHARAHLESVERYGKLAMRLTFRQYHTYDPSELRTFEISFREVTNAKG